MVIIKIIKTHAASSSNSSADSSSSSFLDSSSYTFSNSFLDSSSNSSAESTSNSSSYSTSSLHSAVPAQASQLCHITLLGPSLSQAECAGLSTSKRISSNLYPTTKTSNHSGGLSNRESPTTPGVFAKCQPECAATLHLVWVIFGPPRMEHNV
ncbi:hypothetical protein H5410_027733 [Solanum commersonii]|uniref:Uncharacterized protein n=1 Tax=Solanum commersonii TaxID=4109 RepID=A0A9J5Z004_SOLCO|nr:hypothetical protein H5410_027733 [Solanum commersonii]